VKLVKASYFCDTQKNRRNMQRQTVFSTGTGICFVSKSDNDVAHYNFDADRPILIIFDRDVAE